MEPTQEIRAAEVMGALSRAAPVVFDSPAIMGRAMLAGVAAQPSSPLGRVAAVAGALPHMRRDMPEIAARHCEVARMLADRLGVGAEVHSLAFVYERWDGKGVPGPHPGEAIPLPVRVARVARDSDVQAQRGGLTEAAEAFSVPDPARWRASCRRRTFACSADRVSEPAALSNRGRLRLPVE